MYSRKFIGLVKATIKLIYEGWLKILRIITSSDVNGGPEVFGSFLIKYRSSYEAAVLILKRNQITSRYGTSYCKMSLDIY